MFRRACLGCAASLLALLLFVLVVPLSGASLTPIGPSFLFFLKQDVYILPVSLAMLLSAPLMARGGRQGRPIPNAALGWIAVGIALVLGLIGWAGHRFVFDGYDLSRDEQMATFDAYIFVHGRLLWPLEVAWRPFAGALNQLFILPVEGHGAWVSAYLPGNAALRAVAARVADASLTSPAFVALGALALWRIGLCLWPQSPATRLVVLLLYAGSSQVVVTGMTSYAMSAHLGLDLLWLALFLRGGWSGHVGAIAVGFLATGLHQPLFHPLFVLPFLDILRQRRRWVLLAGYVVAYGLVGAFWLAWPHWMGALHSTAPDATHVGYLERLLHTIQPFDLRAAWLMALNLLRFATWQHLLLLPLLAIGVVGGRADPLVRALAIGLALPVLVMAILLPLQGHGYGYRYLHGVLGNACLIGGFGWRWLETRGLTLRRPFAWASAASMLFLVPAQAFLAHQWNAPYAAVDRAIANSHADLAIVDDRSVPWGLDLVVNRPDLRNRPVRLLASQLAAPDLAGLCRNGSVSFFGRRELDPVARFFGTSDASSGRRMAELEAAARQARCVIEPL